MEAIGTALEMSQGFGSILPGALVVIITIAMSLLIVKLIVGR